MSSAIESRTDQPAASCAHKWIVRVMDRDGQGLLRMLWRMLGREQDVLDAYQDTFCKLATRGNQGSIRSVRAYTYRTAANLAIELIRKRTRHQAHLPTIAMDHHQVQARRASAQEASSQVDERQKDRDESLRVAIAALPPHLGSVIVLRDLQQLPYDEVGRTLGITAATARVYRRHAVVKLAEALDEQS